MREKNAHEARLRTWLDAHGVRAEHLLFDVSCHSVQEAAHAAKAAPEDFVKSICMMLPDGRVVVAVVKGEDRASTTRVQQALDLDARPRLADRKSVV